MVRRGYRELQAVLGSPLARIFKGGGGATKREDGPNEAGGKLVCLRLHFEHFEKLAISQTFNLQKYFFSYRVFYFSVF